MLLRKIRTLASCMVVAGLLLAVFSAISTPAYGENLREAVNLSKQTGYPMLVVVSDPGCPACTMLKQRLATDASLQPLLAEFICVSINMSTDQEELQMWTQQFQPTGNGLPFVYIVTATGQPLVNLSGAPQGDALRQMLASAIETSGGPRNGVAAEQPAPLAPGLAAPGAPLADAGEAEESPTPEPQETPEVAPERPRAEPAPRPRREPAEASDPEADDQAQRNRRLDSYLRMAEMFAEEKPDKAREYIQRILDLSPRSLQAEDARELLDSLSD